MSSREAERYRRVPSITAVTAHRIDDPLATQLEHLTFGDNGLMRDTFRACRRPHSSFEGTCFIARDEHGTVTAWALRWRCFRRGRWSVHVYVDPHRRRNGIATALVEAATYRLRTPLVCHPGNDEAWAFYAPHRTDPRFEVRDHRTPSGVAFRPAA